MLTLHVVRGKSLPALDFNGRSDPFIKINCTRNRFRTTVTPSNLQGEGTLADALGSPASSQRQQRVLMEMSIDQP